MASLYTPEPQRQGLDWLPALVREGQQLWQNKLRIDQEAKRIELQAQQQRASEEHFWATQERLKNQEDFQNRKFLFEMGKDQRDRTRQETLDAFHMEDARADNTRMAKALDYSMDPANPTNQYHASAALENQADTALKKQEFEQEQAAPFQWNMPGKEGEADNPLIPPLLPPGGFKSTGNKMMPIVGKDAAGNPYAVTASQFNKRGEPVSYLTRPITLPTADEDKQINLFQDNLASLSSKVKLPPSAPRDGATDEERQAYQARVAAVEEANAPIKEQIGEVKRKLQNISAQKRIREIPLNVDIVTPEFQPILGGVADAIAKKNIPALQMIRPKVAEAAATGDPGAQQTLAYLDTVLGSPEVAKPRKTGYFK